MPHLKSIAAVSACLLALSCNKPPAAAFGDEFAAAQVAERVYVVEGPLEQPNKANRGFMNNPGFVLTDKGVVVIDPGSSREIGEMLLRKIRAVTEAPVIAVFNTHIHGDHWLGNHAIRQAFPDAVIYGHKDMAAKAAGGEGQSWIELLMRLTEGATAGTEVIVPDTHVQDGDVFGLGGMHFRIHHTGRAHTDGDIMLEVVEAKTLFAGDNLFYGRVPRLDDGSVKGNIAALEHALAGEAQVFVPGHGKVGGPERARDFQRFLKTLRETVQQGYEQGLSDFETKPDVEQALADFRGWAGFDEALGRLISVTYLEVEAEAF